MRTLTQKQSDFVLAYLETGNQAEAYRRAYNCGGMMPSTIRRKAQEVAGLAHVAADIDARRAEAVERNAISVDRIIQELADIAFAAFTDFIESDGENIRLKDFNDLSAAQRAAVRKVRAGPNGQVEIELQDKVRAICQLGKHLGMFTGRPEQDQQRITINLHMGKGKEP